MDAEAAPAALVISMQEKCAAFVKAEVQVVLYARTQTTELLTLEVIIADGIRIMETSAVPTMTMIL